MKKRLLHLLAFLMALATVLNSALWTVAIAAEGTPSASIDYYSLSVEKGCYYIQYAVSFGGFEPNSANTGMLIWTADPGKNPTVETGGSVVKKNLGYTTIDGATYYVFKYDDLKITQMCDVIYARAYALVDGKYHYSDIREYSIVTYAERKLGLVEGVQGTADRKLVNLLCTMLAYGEAEQKRQNYNVDNLPTGILPNTSLTVKFDGNGGEGTTPDRAVLFGRFAEAPADPQRKGYTFTGWYNGDTKWDFQADAVTSALTLTAHWEALVHEHVWQVKWDGAEHWKECEMCGATADRAAHTFGEWVVTKNPTCIEEGVKTATCTHEGCAATKSDSIGKVAHQDKYHDLGDNAQHSHTCATCTISENQAHVPVNAEGEYHAATCEERAYRLFVCTLCKGECKVYDETSNVLGHEWGEWQTGKAATCQEGGTKLRYCQREGCKASETAPTPKNEGHNWQLKETVPATCVAPGSKIYACADCKETKTDPIPATGAHSWADVKDGNGKQECTVCHTTRVVISATEPVKSADLPENENVAVKKDNVDIQLPPQVVSQVKQTGGDVTVSAGEVKDKQTVLNNATNLNAEQKETLKDAPLYDFSLKVGETAVGKFDAKVTVTLPYTLKEGEDPDGVTIWYVAGDGTVEEIKDVHYDAKTGTVTFRVEHFSYYAVAYRETQEMRCRRGVHKFELVRTEEATCRNYGYTVYQCSCCHAVEVQDIAERKAHIYGEVVIGVPTCGKDAWDTRTCSKCGDVLRVKYHAALAHEPDAPATCTTPSVCKTCGQVVTPAKGHNWDAWKTVVEPTEITSGLKRRYCLQCGKCEEVKLAATGNIESVKFNSYQELIELIFSEVLHLENGALKFEYADPQGKAVACTVTVNRENASYLILVEGSYTERGQVNEFSALYRNGLIVAATKDGERVEVGEANAELLSPLPIDVLKNYMEQTFDYINPMVEGYMAQAREMLTVLTGQYGKLANKVLQKLGCDCTVEELSHVLDSVETVYTYLALKLGYQTNLNLLDGVAIPTREDLLRAAKALMTVTEADGLTTYELTGEPLMNLINKALGWYDAHSEMALSELFYELFGADLKKQMPELTDFAACEAAVRRQFTGEMTVKTLVDRLITLLEKQDEVTLEDVYAVIDTLITAQTGKPFSCKDFLAQNGRMTLDEAVQGMTGSQEATFAALLDMVFKYLKETKLGAVTVPMDERQMTVAELVGMARQSLEQMEIKLLLTFTLDADGNLVSFEVLEKLAMLPPQTDTEGKAEKTTVSLVHFTVKRDSTVKVKIPEALLPVSDRHVTASYDENGNLIIRGLDSGYQYDFRIEGYKDMPLEDLLTKDAQMTAKMGFPVYVLPEQYSDRTDSTPYLMKDGKYYSYDWGSYTETNLLYTVSLSDFLAAPEKYMAIESLRLGEGVVYTGDEKTGKETAGESVTVYRSVLGVVFYLPSEGAWCLAKGYGSSDSHDSEGNLIKTTYTIHSYTSLAPYFAENGLRLGDVYSLEKEEIKTSDGTEKNWVRLRLTSDVAESLELTGYQDGNKLMLAVLGTVSDSYYVLGEEVQVPESGKWRTDEEKPDVRDGNDDELDGYVHGWYSAQLPEYYALVDAENKAYVSISDGYVSNSIVVEGLQSCLLPNGKTFYILTEYDGYTFGYTEFAPGAYVQTACRMKDGAIFEVCYRESLTSLRKSFDTLFDVDDFMTKNADGSYTVRAELLAKLKELSTDPGDQFSIQIRGEKETADADYYAQYCVGVYAVPEKLTFGTTRPGTDKVGINWWGAFNNDNPLVVTKNSDGSINIFFRDGSKLERIIYEFQNGFSAESLLKKDTEESDKTGLDIRYREETKADSPTRVYKDGKYYNFSRYGAWKVGTVPSLEEQIAAFRNGWKLGIMTRRYSWNRDMGDGTFEVVPVYEATFYNRFGGNDWYNYNYNQIRLCCVYVNDCLYVLLDTEELGESVLKFEAMVPASTYFANLKYQSTDERQSFGAEYVNGKLVTVYRDIVMLSYPMEGSNKAVNSTRIKLLSYTVDGKTYYYTTDWTREGDVLILEEEWTVPEGYKLTRENTDNDYLNGTFIFRTFTKETVVRTRYIKLADRYYRYDDYENSKRTADLLDEECKDLKWYYVIETEDGEKYYGKIAYDENGNVVLSEELTETLPDGSWSGVGNTADGKPVRKVSYYVLSEAETVTTLSDGSVFCRINGYGYLKTQDGYYFRAELTWKEDGSASVRCLDLRELGRLSDDEIGNSGVLDQYISLNADGNILVVSKDILKVLAEYRNEFSMIILGNSPDSNVAYWKSYVDYWKLEAWLNK